MERILFSWLWISLFLIGSCGEASTSKTKPTLAQEPVDQNILPALSEEAIKDNAPCLGFQKFAVELVALKWVPDTSRLQKIGIYGALDRKKVQYFKGQPFYPIRFNKSSIYHSYQMLNHEMPDALELELFKGVKQAWGYFYKEQGAKGMVTDGVIEEWAFDGEEKAKRALKQLRAQGATIYFNTTPYFARIRNNVFIFHTRASAFCLPQKGLYEQFLTKQGVERAE